MKNFKWYTLIVICLTQVLCASDNSIIINSMSQLVKDFRSDVAAVQLANSVYPLVAGSLMLAGGLLGLRIGWKALLYLGVAIFAAGEVAAVLSPDMLFLTWVARVLAGLGASLAIPAAIGLIPATYTGRDLAIGFGAIGAATGVAAATGPIVGGWIIDSYGWRVAFMVLAIAFAVVFLGALMIAEQRSSRQKAPFDFGGTVLFAVGMGLVTLSLLKIDSWRLWIFGLAVASGFVILALFGAYERRLEKKRDVVLLPSIFLSRKQPRAGLVMTGLMFFMSGGLSFALVTYLQVVVGLNALRTGLVLTTYALGLVVFSLGTPIVLKKASPKRICQAGILLGVASTLLVALVIEPDTLPPLFYVFITAVGSANGMLASQAGVIVTSGIPRDYAAQSGGVQGAMRNIGQAIGIAIMGVIMIQALSASVRHDIFRDPELHAAIDNKIKLSKTVPFISDSQLESYMDKTGFSEEEKSELIQVNKQSRLKALRTANVAYAALMLPFLLFTFQIGDKSTDEDD